MKKVLVRMLAALLLFGTLFGCGSKQPDDTAAETTPIPTEPAPTATPAPEITEGVHESNADYRAYFTTHALTVGDLTIHLEDRIFSEEKLYILAEAVAADLAVIRERTGKETGPVTVYVVDSKVNGRMAVSGNEAVCSAEDVESGVYREALCGACFKIAIPWKQVGLSRYVFGTVDESELKAYYADEAHALTASCADVYLQTIAADEQTVSVAKQTAGSIAAFVIDTEGFDAFLAMVSTAEALPAWSERLGLETAPILPEGNAEAATVTVESRSGYLLQARNGNIIFQILKDSFADTPDTFYRLTCDFYYGVDLVLAQIRAEIPSYAALAEERFRLPLTIKIVDPTRRVSAFNGGNELMVMYEKDIWHELVHFLLEEYKYERTSDWICEGLANHFSLRAAAAVMSRPYTLEEAFSFDPDELTEQERTYLTLLPKVYEAVDETDPGRQEGYFNQYAFIKTLVIGSMLFPKDVWLGRTNDETVGGARQQTVRDKESDGNALTYLEALTLLDYAFDTYGEETFMDGYMHGVPLKETIGKSYAALYAEFCAYVQETYGYLVSNENE